MKLNTEDTALAVLALPRVSTKLDDIAASLGRFASEFGIEFDKYFAPRLATVGFGNAVLLGLEDAAAGSRLNELLAAEDIPPPAELSGLTPLLAEAVAKGGNWTVAVNCALGNRWLASSDNTPNIQPRLDAVLRTLHGIRAGLLIAHESPEAAQKVAEKVKALSLENRFLTRRLLSWRNNNWQPPWAPFVEFAASSYAMGSIEQQVMTKAIAEVYPIAKALNNPWGIPFWAETGWNGGRNFVRNHSEDCKALLKESGQDNLKVIHRAYQQSVIGTARSDGEVQIERATLFYFGLRTDVDFARCYCMESEPRRLARVAYDFAFWMGIFASYPVPTAAE